MTTALVTGSAQGLGKLIAEALTRDGFEVIHFDHATKDDVRYPIPGSLYLGDRPLHVLINCAGVNRIAWLEDVTDDLWDLVMDTNVKGIMKMTQRFLSNLKAAQGTVLNIVSNASHMPMRGSAAYNASKGAAHILTLQMARELYGRHGITVFGISPNKLKGTGMSEDIDQQVMMTRGWTREEAQAYQRLSLAINEETDPATLAEFIGFLLSSKQRHKYLHGCVLPYGA